MLQPTLHGCVTSRRRESAPADPVGGLAAWQNSASCDGRRTTSTLPLRPARTVYAPGCGCLWKILKRQIEQEPAGNQLGKRHGDRPPPHKGFPQVLRPRHELEHNAHKHHGEHNTSQVAAQQGNKCWLLSAVKPQHTQYLKQHIQEKEKSHWGEQIGERVNSDSAALNQ